MAIANSTISHIQSEVTSSNFTLETNAHVFKMLTTNIYNDVILAGIRELFTNGIDGCQMGNLPIKLDVHVPTISDPAFSVRDYGVGISPEQMMSFYTTMGASNKRDSNAYNGQFGIGKLAPLAYATSFTVQSFYDSFVHEYLVSIDNGIPVIIKLSSKPTSEHNGLKVSYTVQPSDVEKFRQKMEYFYRFSNVKPNLSEPLDIDMTSKISISGTDWYIFDNPDTRHSDAYIVMANVPYKVSPYTYDMPQNSVITVPTGSVSITPGRETLNYDDKTDKTVKAAVDRMKAEVTTKANTDIALADTPWEQVFIANTYCSNFKSIITPKSLSINSNFQLRYGSTFLLADPANTSFFLADFNGSTTRKCQYFDLYRDTLFIKQDVPSKFVDALNKLPGSTYKKVIIKPTSNTLLAIEAMVPAADKWLDELGIPATQVYSISDYITETTKSAPTAKLANTVFQPTRLTGIYDGEVRKYKGDNISLTDNTQEYLYFEMKGNDILADSSTVLATVALAKHTNSLPIIGVPQKAIKQVETDPNFTLATDYFKALVPTLPTFKVHSLAAEEFLSRYPNAYTRLYPKDITDLRELAKAYTDTVTVTATFINRVNKYYNISSDTLTDVEQFNITSKYPLFSSIINDYTNRSKRDTLLKHYFALEQAYADNPPD